MANKSLMFVVLTICGTVCILASLVAVTWLYHSHAALLEIHDPHGIPPEVKFAVFVGLPSLVGFIIGFKLVKTGVDIGVKS